MTDFFAMGGYAAYVWGAYGVSALTMIGLLAASLRRLKVRKAAIRQLQPEARRIRTDRPSAGTATGGGGDHAA